MPENNLYDGLRSRWRTHVRKGLFSAYINSWYSVSKKSIVKKIIDFSCQKQSVINSQYDGKNNKNSQSGVNKCPKDWCPCFFRSFSDRFI